MAEERKLKKIVVTKDMIRTEKTTDLNFDPIETESVLPWYKSPKILLTVSFTLLVVAQGYLALKNAFDSSMFLGTVYFAVIGCAVLAVARTLIREAAACAVFRSRKTCRETDVKTEVCELLAKQKCNRGADVAEAFGQWKQRADSFTAAKDVKSAYSELILEPFTDKKAVKIISANSLQTAAFVATSPFVFTDMLFVFAANLRMTSQIAECYGMELGLSVRWRIYKTVFRNMMTAGGAELLTDMASPLGVGLIGKFSAKIGQGMLSGLYAARLGVKVAELCRPVEFTDKNRPSTSIVFKSIYEMFKDRKLIEEEQ